MILLESLLLRVVGPTINTATIATYTSTSTGSSVPTSMGTMATALVVASIGQGGLSIGAQAGMGVGAGVGGVLLLAVGGMLIRRRRRRARQAGPPLAETEKLRQQSSDTAYTKESRRPRQDS